MNTTLDQWEVLETVVQLGSFAAAAARMNRSQSTISYAISRLQEQFDMPLLELNGRRAQLTEAGKTLLAEVEPLLTRFRAVEERGSSLAASGKTEIRLSVDSLFPDGRLFTALSELSRAFPHVHPQLRQGTFLTSAQEVHAFGADFCLTALPEREDLYHPVVDIRMWAVARADHPLHARSGPLSRADLIQHLSVVIEGAAGTKAKQQPHNPSQRFVAVNAIESAIEAVRSGLCFGWLPAYRIEPLLAEGEFQRLPLLEGAERMVRLFLVCKEMECAARERNHLALLLGANRAAVEVL